MILIISHAGDAHVPMVTAHLDRDGHAWGLLATDQLGEQVRLGVAVGDQPRLPRLRVLLGDGREVESHEIRAVWNRRRVVGPVRAAEASSDVLRAQFVREQRLALLEGAFTHIQARWINAQHALVTARPKLQQLHHAAMLGLRIPATLASDDPEEVRAFADIHRRTGVITKVLSAGTPIVPDGQEQYVVFTQRFDPTAVSDAQIAAAPAIYQVEISKAFEARAIVVGDRVLCCRIDSQSSPLAELDWRHYDFARVNHAPIELPDDVADALRRLCRRYGLVYGAVDLACTPDGDWVFFELNPNGQWGWLEEYGGVQISKALAAELAA